MSALTCPHCHAVVPFGAHVCRGCQAEVHYGPPKSLFTLLFFSSLFLAALVGAGTSFIVGLAAFGAAQIGGSYWLNNRYRNRTNFKRLYRTR